MRPSFVRFAIAAGLALALTALLPAAADAQTGKLTGVIRDQAGQALEGAEVFIDGTGLTTFSASNGRYFFLSVPPGTYTLVARRIGHQTVSQRGIIVAIDVTREVNFTLAPAEGPTELREIVVEAPAVPLVQPGVSNSTIGISGDVIRALPVVTVEGALKLQQGFLQVPDNSDIISFSESRRNVSNPIRIRGGRGGETLQLIDGIPTQNWIYGGPAISITPEAVQQLDYIKGGMEPQYGNALSGVVNIATRDGGTNLAGSLRFQTSEVGGAMGNDADDLLNYSLFDGYLSGPIPGFSNKLRFMFSGRQQRSADAVYEFDNDVRDPSCTQNANPNSCSGNPSPFMGANFMDVYGGWRAFGAANLRELSGKLTYFFRPTMKLGVSYLDSRQQRQPFDFTYMLTYDPAIEAPVIDNLADSVAVIGNRTGSRIAPLDFAKVVMASINAGRSLAVARWDHILGRTSYTLAVGQMKLERTTCNFWQGVCLGDNFGDPNFTDDQFISPLASTCASHPTCGTDYFYGGENLKSQIFRGDLQSQVTDHHNLAGGAMYMSHDVSLDLLENIGGNQVTVYSDRYSAKPWDLALYIQDRIEYDFLTVKLGVRYDLGSAGGTFWADPLDPTNGTTAADVCANPGDWQNRTFREYDASGDSAYSTTMSANPNWGTQLGTNCVNLASGQVDPATLDSAARIAASDDFSTSKQRRQFSPRIGVSFPLGPSSALFFNFGRNTQNPLHNNLFKATGIGTTREGTVDGPTLLAPGDAAVPYVGNSNLLTEQTTSYEIGYAAELGGDYAIAVTAFSKDQIGLTGFRTGGQRDGVQVFDPGATYANDATPSYRVLVNQDFQTVRGVEVQLRRRVSNFWGFDLNYSFSEARTNAADPEREVERQIDQNDPRLNQEVTSDVDQPHVFNASLIFQTGRNYPRTIIGKGLQNFSTSLVFRMASGLPYTPTLDFYGTATTQGFPTSQLVRNTGRGPSTFQLDWSLSKDFLLSNVRYGFTLQVLNLTDRKNCIQVYTTTGQCTVGAVDVSRNREGNNIAADAITTTYLDRAQYFGARRSVQAGLRVSF